MTFDHLHRVFLHLRPLACCLALGWTGIPAFAEESPGERLPLWPKPAPDGLSSTTNEPAFLTVHLPAKPTGTAVVICPGGGYGGLVTGGEGTGIARWLNGHGIAGIVLEYRLPHGRSRVPLLDAQQAIRTVRFNAGRWLIDSHHVGIIGFSAGGHLASTAATHFDSGIQGADSDSIDRQSSRPDFAILVYPVISMGEKGHAGSRLNLLGPNPSPAERLFFSSEQQVTPHTPPVFLAHAVDDKVVSIDNSRLFYAALLANGVHGKLLELPSGDHGLNGYQGPMWDSWQRESIQWLTTESFLPGVVSPK
jgi:acetyl esterase/lipase